MFNQNNPQEQMAMYQQAHPSMNTQQTSQFMFGGQEEEEEQGYAKWLLDNRTDVDEFFDALTGRYWDLDFKQQKHVLKQNSDCALINDVGAMQLRSVLRMELHKSGAVSKLDKDKIGESLTQIHIALARFLAVNKRKYEIKNRVLILNCLVDSIERHIFRSLNGWEREVQKKSHRVISADRRIAPISKEVRKNYGKNMF